MSKETISVIVPVYNSEKSIFNCIESILSQSFTDFKIYIVNDGSTDNSDKILTKFENHPKIKIVSKANEGVSIARNVGLDLAEGKYIAFIDSDDTIERDYLKTLVDNINYEDVTLAVSSYNVIDLEKNTKSTPSFSKNELDTDLAIEYIISEKGPQGYLWNKLFIAEIIHATNLRFDSEIFMAEDLLFVINYLVDAGGKIKITNSPVYNYMIYGNSSNKTRLASLSLGYEKYFENFLLCTEKIDSLLPKNYKKSKVAIQGRKGRIAVQYLRANALMKNESKKLLTKLRKIAIENRRSYFLGIDGGQKARVIYILTVYFPLISKLRDKKHYGY
ncbi:glycosyltransferase [Streptococcus suis]|uniref:glycosyltransferase n=1 Tax=Streptococcus suis TaxID=1307 RepID=UPI0021176576|nr:glycosyltransferase [Streptococcus suis]